MIETPQTREQLIEELNQIRLQLEEAEETLRAIRQGEVDALVVDTIAGEQIFTLQGAEHPYRIMIESIAEGTATLLPDGTIIYCNHRLAEMLSVPLQNLIGSHLSAFIHPADLPLYEALLKYGASESRKDEIQLQRADGNFIPTLLSMSPVPVNSTGGICLVATDLTQQKRTHEIIAAERMTRSILQQAAEAIVVCDAKGIIIRANNSAYKIAERTPVFLPFDKAFPLTIDKPELNSQSFSIKAVLDGNSYLGIQAHFRPTVTSRLARRMVTHVQVSATPFLNEEGEIIGCIIMLTDNTEYVAGQEQLIYQSLLLNNIHDSVIGFDQHFHITYWNKASETLFGWTSEEAMGKSIHDLLHTEISDHQQALRKAELDRNGFSQQELVEFNRSGKRLMIDTTTIVLKDPKGRIIGYAAARRDITERRLTEASLKESQDRLSMATQAAEIGIWSWDLVKDDLRWDAQSREFFNIPVGEPVSYSKFIQLVHPDDRTTVDQAIHDSLKSGRELEIEYRTIWEDGTVHWLYAKGRSYFSGIDTPDRLVGIVMDTTARKLAEEEKRSQLAQIEAQHRLMDYREKERLQIARDIHDGPLQELIAISFAIQGVLTDLKGAPPHDSIKMIQGSLLHQISELRSFAGALRPPSLSAFGIEFAIRSHLETFNEKYPDISVEFESDPIGLHAPEMVRLALYRIYQELMNNIVKHSQATQVSIQLSGKGDFMELLVQDNGIGFETPSPLVSNIPTGHLGILGMRERAEAVGGKLLIRSHPGQGTLAQVIIPLAK
jgi:PAS domain S-box-containing protein